MPIYEYDCTVCGQSIEKLQKLSDPPLLECPACGAMALKKRISAAGFRLSGGGWYETDFKGGNKKNLSEGGGSTDSTSGKPAVSTTETTKTAKAADKPPAADKP
jgi:putative FmdB family regulatory protein